MKNKKLTEIIEKIRNFEQKSILNKILIRPPIPKQLEELQKYIINSHIEVGKLMSEMIRVKLWASVYEKNNPIPSIRLLAGIRQVVEYLPYKDKTRILCLLESSFKPLKRRIMRINEIRNTFAHTELKELIKEYNVDNVSGAQKILDKYEFFEKLKEDLVEIGLKVKDYQDYAGFIQEFKESKKKPERK